MTPFIAADEHIILMDYPLGRMDLADMATLAGMGVRTAFYSVNSWQSIEPRQGHYDWSMPDMAVERAARVGMKLLIHSHGNCVSWAPDDWYCKDELGRIWRNQFEGYKDNFGYNVFSPWNPEAQAYENEFLRMTCKRYNSATVQVVWAGLHGGEAILPGMCCCWFDDKALESFRRYADDGGARPGVFATCKEMEDCPGTVAWLEDSLMVSMLAKQLICAQGHSCRETWLFLPERDTPMGELFETGPRSCNWLAGQLRLGLPPYALATLNQMLFEVFRPDGDQGTLAHIAGYEGITWTGSQYAEGLVTNTERAIAAGLRGFLTGPLHPDAHKRTMSPAMFQAFEWSLSKWREARQ